MIRPFVLIALIAPAMAFAQSASDSGSAPLHTMNHMQMMHDAMMHDSMMNGQQAGTLTPTQPGQGAFAAIQEIVGILAADPKTDWSKVDIEGLRQHLIDMNNVTLAADVKNEPIDGGMRFVVTGTGAVRDSIRRMVGAHAATMNGVGGWRFEAAEIDAGATLTARPPAKDADKLRGLGFIGVLTLGMHHQQHHLMLARGQNPHQPM